MVFSGYVFDKVLVSDNVTLLITKQKHNDIYLNICFTAYGDAREYIELHDIDKKDSVRIVYHIKSKKHGDSWFTNLIIDQIELKEKAPLVLEI